MDKIDSQLLQLLQDDASLTNKQLANAVGLAPSSCLGRVRRFRNEGIVKGIHAEVNPGALGIGFQAMLFVRLSKQARKFSEGFPSFLSNLPEVVALYFLSGPQDLLVHVAVRDADHFKGLMLGQLLARDEVEHVESSLILDSVQSHRLPNYRDTSTVPKE